MSKTVKIKGLDCANCARVLEEEINKLPSVKTARVDFVKSTIVFDGEENALKDIIKLTKEVEPEAKIVDVEAKKKIEPTFWINLALLCVGIAIGVCALLIDMPTWAFWTLYVVAILLLGYQTYLKAIKLLFKGIVNENLLITISVVGATAIGEQMEALMVIALYSIGKILESLAVNKSRKSIEELTNLKPDYAVLLEDGEERKVDPADVEIGSKILVRPGEKIALDGKVISGSATLDMQSLTGESVPVSVCENAEVLSGAIVLDGVLEIETTSNYGDSTVHKILDLIENASDKKSKTETVISKVTKWYTLAVMALAVCVWAVVWAVTKQVNTAVYRGLIFLVVSCPCAFAISVPLSYFSGIGNASKNGILIKGSNYLDACAKLNVVAFDKTGTLTTGEFSVENVEVFDENLTADDLLFVASIGEQYSLHPLAKSIVASCDRQLPKPNNVKEIAGEGVQFEYNEKSYFVGRKSQDLKSTAVELYEGEKRLGIVYLRDTIKEGSKTACKELSQMNVKTVLLSGDNQQSVESVANEIGIDEFHAKLLPADKYNWIESKKKDKTAFVGYVGDGINDAPSLMLADVGISMGINGNSASIEASNIVLVDDNPQKVGRAIKISKFTRKIVWENIIFAAVVKLVFLTLGAVGVTGMLSAVIADVGVTLLAILNSIRALRYHPNGKQK